jgi:transmembrane sensor
MLIGKISGIFLPIWSGVFSLLLVLAVRNPVEYKSPPLRRRANKYKLPEHKPLTALQIDQNVLDQAYAWIVALRGDKVSEQNLEEFSGWLAEDSSHQLAWDEALDLLERMGVARHLPLEELLADNPVAPNNNTEIDADPQLAAGFSLLEKVQALLKPIALASLLAVVGLVAVVTLQPQGEIYTAGTGQYLAVTLDDGSVVELNTNSEISVSMTEERREVELHRGEVFFTVAKDSDRPFIVDISGATVRAVGTAFNIYRVTDQSAIVSVSEGIVRVEEADGSSVTSAQSKLLTVDEALEIDALRGLSESSVETSQATAWRQGQLLFDNTPIGQAVEMLNRYLHHKIIIADDVPKNIKVSGTFSSREKRATLTAVAQALGMELTSQDNKWLLSQPKP